MKQRLRTSVVGLYCLLAAALVTAQPASQAETESGLGRLHSALALGFGLSNDNVGIEPEVRRAAQALAEQALPRIRATLATWLEEERGLAPSATLQQHLASVWARAVNEMALWQLDSAGPAHDLRRQRAMAHPRSCEVRAKRRTLFDELARVWQSVPASERAAHFEDETQLLNRWGAPRQMVPARPVPSIEERAWKLIERYLVTGQPLPIPLTPVLSWQVHSEDDVSKLREDRDLDCAWRQWLMQLDLLQQPGGIPAEQWLAYRFSVAPVAQAWSGWPEERADLSKEYPTLAQRYGVEGDVTVEVALDAQGRQLERAVVKRAVVVPGIRGQRPVAFETLLDAASLLRARALPSARPDPARLRDGRATRRYEMAFKLE